MSGAFGGWTDEDTYDLYEEPEHDTDCWCDDPECDRCHADDGIGPGTCICGEMRVPTTEAEARLGFGFWRCPAERREVGYLRKSVRRSPLPPILSHDATIHEAIETWYSVNYPFGVRLSSKARSSLGRFIAQRVVPQVQPSTAANNEPRGSGAVPPSAAGVDGDNGVRLEKHRREAPDDEWRRKYGPVEPPGSGENP